MKKQLAIVLFISLLCLACTDNKVAVGQVWCYEIYKGDPFKPPKIYRYKVLEVKGGHVLYENLADGTKDSSSERMFKIGSAICD